MDICTGIAFADHTEFNYHLFDVGPICTTLGWTISGNCIPLMFTLQGFHPQNINLNSPSLSLHSTSPTFNFISTSGIFYFRFFGTDRNGISCNDENSRITLYNFTEIMERGKSVFSTLRMVIIY